MNKFALTTVAALPGSGGGCVSKLSPEVNKQTGVQELALEYKTYDRVVVKRVDPVMAEANRRAKEQREKEKMLKHAMNYGAKREDFNHAAFVVPPEWEDLCKQQAKAKREAMTLRLGNAMTLKEYEEAWKEIASEPELEEYFSSRN